MRLKKSPQAKIILFFWQVSNLEEMSTTTKFDRFLNGTDTPVCARATSASPAAGTPSLRRAIAARSASKKNDFFSTMNFYRNRHSAAKTKVEPHFYSTIIGRGRRFHSAHEWGPRP
jgi:hypothetical protein